MEISAVHPSAAASASSPTNDDTPTLISPPEKEISTSKSTPDQKPISSSTEPGTKASSTPIQSPPTFCSSLKKVAIWILDKWLVIGIGFAALFGYFFPDVAKPYGAIHSEWTIIYGAVAIIFLVSGLSIHTEKLLIHFANMRLHLTVQGMTFLFTPTVFFCIVMLIIKYGDPEIFDRGVITGLIVTGCIPTTLSSNIIMTRLSGGDEAAALVSVTVGNLLGPFLTPILITNVFWPTMDRSFDEIRPAADIGQLKQLYSDVFKQIGLTVLLPLTVGQVVQGYFTFEKTSKWVQKLFLNRISTFCLTLLVWAAFSACFATNSLQSMPKPLLLMVIFLNIGLYLFFTALCPLISLVRIPYPSFNWKDKRFYIARLKRLDREVFISICFCAPAKTTGLGLPMVTAMWTRFPEEVKARIQIPVVLYTIEQIFLAQVLVWWFQRGNKKIEEKEEREGGEEGVLRDRRGREDSVNVEETTTK